MFMPSLQSQDEFCSQFSFGIDCEDTGVCWWVDSEDCEYSTFPPAPTQPPGYECCTGDTPQTWQYCHQYGFPVDCIRAVDCYWIHSQDPSDCEEVTGEPTVEPTMGPTYPEGCCAGETPQTASFCSGLGTGEDCESAAVCTWVETDDPEDCILPGCCRNREATFPPILSTMNALNGISNIKSDTAPPEPFACSQFDTFLECDIEDACEWIQSNDPHDCLTPAPTYSPSGCCRGYHSSQDAFCGPFDNGADCEDTGVCWWVEDLDECEGTPPPEGCCVGDTPITWQFCHQYGEPFECGRAIDCDWIIPPDPSDCIAPSGEPTLEPTLHPSTEPTLEPTSEGCCNALQTFGGSKAPYFFCITLNEVECNYAVESCEWIVTDDMSDCGPPTSEPTTPAPTYSEEGCCRGYDQATDTFCSGFTNGEFCETAAVCTWYTSVEDCEATMPPSITPPPAPTHPEPGCCTGIWPNTIQFCNTLVTEHHCVGAAECVWVITNDTTECLPPTDPPTLEPTMGPTYPEGCCAGETPQTASFCSGLGTGEDCESAAVCTWVETDDPEDCILPGCCRNREATFPPILSTMNALNGISNIKSDTAPPEPFACSQFDTFLECDIEDACEWIQSNDPHDCLTPAPTYSPSGCCRGYHSSQDAFCGPFDNGADCEDTGVCWWVEDLDECEGTPPPEGCCVGDTPITWQFCHQYGEPFECGRAIDCDWIIPPDPSDCIAPSAEPTLEPTVEPTQPGCCSALQTFGGSKAPYFFCITLNEMECDYAVESCEWIVTDDISDCGPPTLEPTTPSPTYSEEGCCRGETPQTDTFCSGFETGDFCETASVCTWYSSEEDCERTFPPSETPPPAPTHAGDGCCIGVDPMSWGFCVTQITENHCTGADVCSWIIPGDESECEPPTEAPTLEPTLNPTYPEGCCAGLRPMTSQFCNGFDNGEDCLTAEVCSWIVTSDPTECLPTPSPTDEPGCCRARYRLDADAVDSDGNPLNPIGPEPGPGNPVTIEPGDPGHYKTPYSFCNTLGTEWDCEGAEESCEWIVTDDMSDCALITEELTPSPTEEPGCCKAKMREDEWSDDTVPSDPSKYKTPYSFCNLLTDERMCNGADDRCEWIVTDDMSDCALPTDAPGCCMGSTTKTYQFCGGLDFLRECIESTNCEWIETTDPTDCEPPTAAPGCCAGDSLYASTRCTSIIDEDQCGILSSCHWIETEDDSDCDWSSTTQSPSESGCCYIADIDYLDSQWVDICTEFWSEQYCLAAVDEYGVSRCEWTPMPDEYDCSILWPTPPPEVGCCRGNSYQSADRCLLTETKNLCDRMSICHWIDTDDMSQCQWASTTTLEPPAPGCCILADTRPSAYENGWDQICREYWTQKDCEQPYSADGYQRCEWTPTEGGFDCSQLWPTPEPTTKPLPGCCTGDSRRATTKCIIGTSEEQCNRMSSCHWIVTDDPSECEWTSTTASPPEPGCCYVNMDTGYQALWMDICSEFWNEDMCLTPITPDGTFRCHWEPAPDAYDCSLLWPTTTPSPSGCCKGDSAASNVICNGFETEDGCIRMAACHWMETDDPYECLWITTTQSPPAPGCCMLSDTRPMSYEMGWDGQCTEFWTENQCVRPYSIDGVQRCNWIDTEEDQDCSELWPSAAPTISPEPGCCAATSPWAVDVCSAEISQNRCDRMSNCHWLATSDYTQCEWTSTTATPGPPGCCTLNDIDDYADGWSQICKAFWNEDDCIRPVSLYGVARCAWTETEQNYDCSQLWPTTTEEPNGCCAGDSESAAERCVVESTQERCDRRSSCHWILSDDPYVCQWGSDTTLPPYDPGCCIVAEYGGSMNDEMWAIWSSQCTDYFTERQCLMPTSDDGDYRCTWIPTREHFDCQILWPTENPVATGCCTGDSAYATDKCAMSGNADHCNRLSSCHWVVTDDPSDCEWQSTSTTPPPPGCCFLHQSQNPMSGWTLRCTEYWNELDCKRSVDKHGNPRCTWASAPEGYDCELMWPATTEEIGCCAADTGKAYDRCKGSDCKRDCNAMSDCHWIVTEDKDDCKWVPPEEPNKPGCCTLCSSQSPDSPYLEVCPDFWNKEDCLTPEDYYGVKRCQWTPTKENVDCTILWPTEDPQRDLSWNNEDDIKSLAANERELLLPSFDGITVMGQSLDLRLSLSIAIMLLASGIMICKLARTWAAKRFNSRGDREEFGYIKIADMESDDSVPPPVWSNEESYGYGSYAVATQPMVIWQNLQCSKSNSIVV